MDNKVFIYSCQDMQTDRANHSFTEVYNTVKERKRKNDETSLSLTLSFISFRIYKIQNISHWQIFNSTECSELFVFEGEILQANKSEMRLCAVKRLESLLSREISARPEHQAGSAPANSVWLFPGYPHTQAHVSKLSGLVIFLLSRK